MKVALVTALLSPAAGGLASSVPSLARGLTRKGVDTHVVGVEDPEDPGAGSRWGQNVHSHVQPLRTPFRYAPDIGTTLASLRPDVVDVQGIWTYPSLANLRHHIGFGTPYVITPRGMLDPWARDHSRWKKALVRHLFEDQHLAKAFCLRATATMEAEHLRSFGLRNPIAVVPNSVSIPPLQGGSNPRPGMRRLLFLSRIHPKKGLPYLLRAWAAVEDARPDWELIIAGPDELNHTKEMQLYARKLNVSRVRWLGPIHGEAKSSLYAGADIFILPTHAENFGLVVAEALSHGVPAITTRNAPWSGLREYGCGWWIDLNDQTLRATLLQATELPRRALGEMGRKGRAWMEKDFGEEKLASNMLEVYSWVVKGDNLPSFVLT
ncbi:glycosyltransferase [Rhodobacter sphaeroides]|uniref:glycosyltransferase n=1 Tax=Cereibacter sphaeroides TaxID=1063 RepID=UPI00005C8209|nr:glycosyltransferase [Cereibacter sphaeroides]AXC64065.1 glycosyltransferase [Cereibacter sphaeroides 2.4.1]MVX50435.1 glycosyltransferase [Cereibacter sphaeroides]QHA12198.1 glycosyltransferase [Cereibacter sphaeroides]QHA15462.1 glycosyltransferase [Cereibacter sphaeroides]QJC86746.1 glycosyltransferase [Cereibacter sphaeroides]